MKSFYWKQSFSFKLAPAECILKAHEHKKFLLIILYRLLNSGLGLKVSINAQVLTVYGYPQKITVQAGCGCRRGMLKHGCKNNGTFFRWGDSLF